MTIKRVTFLQELLGFLGMEGRLHLEWISSAEAQKFVQVVTDFTEKIRALGPSPLSFSHQRIGINGTGFSPSHEERIENMTSDTMVDKGKEGDPGIGDLNERHGKKLAHTGRG